MITNTTLKTKGRAPDRFTAISSQDQLQQQSGGDSHRPAETLPSRGGGRRVGTQSTVAKISMSNKMLWKTLPIALFRP